MIVVYMYRAEILVLPSTALSTFYRMLDGLRRYHYVRRQYYSSSNSNYYTGMYAGSLSGTLNFTNATVDIIFYVVGTVVILLIRSWITYIQLPMTSFKNSKLKKKRHPFQASS